MPDSPETFDSYAAFIERFVRPRHEKGWTRLDGKTTGSSPRTAARMWHQGKPFRAHEDASVPALLRPYHFASEQGIDVGQALIVERGRVRNGKASLKLKPWDGNDKGFYVYLDD